MFLTGLWGYWGIRLGYLKDRRLQINLEGSKNQGLIDCCLGDSVVIQNLRREKRRKAAQTSSFFTLPSHMTHWKIFSVLLPRLYNASLYLYPFISTTLLQDASIFFLSSCIPWVAPSLVLQSSVHLASHWRESSWKLNQFTSVLCLELNLNAIL